MRNLKKIIIYLISAILLFGVGYGGYGIATKYISPKNENTNENETETTKKEEKENKKEERTAKKEKKEKKEIEEPQSDEWKEAYIEWINKQKEGATFKLCYVNEDSIPEIISFGECNADGTTFATYANGKVQEKNVWGMGVSYIERKNVLDDGSGNMGNYYDHIYAIQNGKWVQIAKGEYGIGDNMELDPADESDYSYTWNGKNMSKENYKKNLKKIYDKKYATNLEGSDKCVSAEKIIDELNGADGKTTQAARKAVKVVYKRYKNDQEYMTVKGLDSERNVVWKYTTDKHPSAELEATGCVRRNNKNKVYIFDSEKIISKRISDGKTLWTAMASPAGHVYKFDSKENLYIVGYYDNVLYKISAEGENIWETDLSETGNYWPEEISVSGAEVTVLCDGNDNDVDEGTKHEVVLSAETGEIEENDAELNSSAKDKSMLQMKE